jgi:hypothetical protein
LSTEDSSIPGSSTLIVIRVRSPARGWNVVRPRISTGTVVDDGAERPVRFELDHFHPPLPRGSRLRLLRLRMTVPLPV